MASPHDALSTGEEAPWSSHGVWCERLWLSELPLGLQLGNFSMAGVQRYTHSSWVSRIVPPCPATAALPCALVILDTEPLGTRLTESSGPTTAHT